MQMRRGAAHEGAADGDHLLLAAGEGAGELGAAFLDAGEELVDALEVLLELGAALAGVGAHFEVFEDRHAGEQAPGLEHRADAALDAGAGGEALDGQALEQDGAGGGADDAHDGLHGGRFAAGVCRRAGLRSRRGRWCSSRPLGRGGRRNRC